MSLFNKRFLRNAIHAFDFPTGQTLERKLAVISTWQKSLKDSDLEKTKETSIQGAFLQKFFENLLDYTSQFEGKSEWNLVQHLKTEVDTTQADGTLGFYTAVGGSTRAVIELKDAKTPLDKKQTSRKHGYTPVEQAHLYSLKFDGCNWIIVSNFKEIRLYNKHRSLNRYEIFDVLTLNEPAEFKRFYYLLCFENLIARKGKSAIDRLIEDTNEQEEDISKKFYQDFKMLREKLFQHLSENNPSITDKALLLEQTQKLLDRLIFILFCEDMPGLLPSNLIRETYDRALRSFSASETRIWDEFRGLFRAVDEGNTRVRPPINAYNGGLFEPDEVLDNLVIQDKMFEELVLLAKYDFESDLNVNILGHIFEQSISDIEQFKASLSGDEIPKRNGKRKKEGIYYTPEYITRYLVEQTVGAYLDEHPDKLEQLTILDPACGSGAFLNQAHTFLQQQWQVAYEEGRVKSKDAEFGGMFDYNPIENDRSMVLRNLYGVDLNNESVEITKLALWLKTARPDKPLQNLDENIKCGNSLVNDTTVAGDKAFSWDENFPQVMAEGGFDVVVGNPPYIFARDKGFSEQEKKYYYKHFELASYQLNTYLLFIERVFNLLKDGGYLAFIVPNTWLTINTFSALREFLLKQTSELQIVNIYDKVFEDASVDTCLLIFRKGKPTGVKVGEFRDGLLNIIGEAEPELFLRDSNVINISLVKHKEIAKVIKKIEADSQVLGNIAEVKAGLKAYETGKGEPIQTDEMKNNRVWHSDTQVDNSYARYLEGRDVERYGIVWGGHWLKYGKNLAAPRDSKLFVNPRILIRQIPSLPPYSINAVFINEPYLNDINSMIVLDFKDVDPLFILAVLNSRLTTFWFVHTFDKFQRKTFPQFKVNELKKFPIPIANNEQQQRLAEKARRMMELREKLHLETSKALEIIKAEYNLKAISQRLQGFYELGWNEFVDELEKQKVKLSLKQKDELHDWFREKQKQLGDLRNLIAQLDRSIDVDIYALYGLTNDEIHVIEALDHKLSV